MLGHVVSVLGERRPAQSLLPAGIVDEDAGSLLCGVRCGWVGVEHAGSKAAIDQQRDLSGGDHRFVGAGPACQVDHPGPDDGFVFDSAGCRA